MKRVYYHTLGEYHIKPRKGIKVHCIGINCLEDDEAHADHTACVYHEYRWQWNLRTWWQWHFKQNVTNWYRKHIRVPIGGLRNPVPLEWKDSFDGMADRIIPNGEPVCPRCGEMPYSYEQCAFCGQRFPPEEASPDKTAPQREMREGRPIVFMDGICPECGYSCGNGGYGLLRCRCGWVGEEKEMSSELKQTIEELFEDDTKWMG